MKQIEKYLEEVVKIKPLGKVTTVRDTEEDREGEFIHINGSDSGLYVKYVDYISWLEKEKIETTETALKHKFTTGDWVVDNCDNVWQVVEISNTHYLLKDINDSESLPKIKWADETFHLWTFKDVRKGDVLVHNGGTFIFMGIENGIVQAYEENLLNGTKTCNFGEPDKDNDYTPATKEQWDTLEKAINNAGYTFNFDKKELVKLEDEPENYKQQLIDETADLVTDYIQQNPAEWNEKDSKTLQRIIDFLWYNRKGDTDTIYQQEQDIEWLKSLRPQKLTWNSEDEVRLASTIQILEYAKSLGAYNQYGKESIEKNIEWLRSLQLHANWKPEKEEVMAFEHFVRSLGESGYASPYENNTKRLQSLLQKLKTLVKDE